MMIACLLENAPETRVAITPSSAKRYLEWGFEVAIEKGAGVKAGFSDADYLQLGVQVIDKASALCSKAQVLLCLNEPKVKTISSLAAGSLIVGIIDNPPSSEFAKFCERQKISVFSMQLIPRISRAQSMDSLSSQANLAGYRAVLEASTRFQRALPMMMTAAGMIPPAKVLILGAGVAGLQAIATAKRLGAVVTAFDVRQAAKEQVESLGAEFIEVSQDSDAETSSGYASESSEAYKKLQAERIDHYAQLADIIITTALIPNRDAPRLLYKETLAKMRPGSIIVDMATARGGNCEGSVLDQVVTLGEVTIIGYSNLAGLVPTTASNLYATNLANLIALLAPKPAEIVFNPQDEIIQQALLYDKGHYLPFQKLKEI
jgi:NAD(P) transhydrogenase subunit alpha